MKKRRTPYQKICDAAAAGRGCRLTADDCFRLAQDTAIEQRAELDNLDECEASWHYNHWFDRPADQCRQCPRCGEVDPRVEG